MVDRLADTQPEMGAPATTDLWRRSGLQRVVDAGHVCVGLADLGLLARHQRTKALVLFLRLGKFRGFVDSLFAGLGRHDAVLVQVVQALLQHRRLLAEKCHLSLQSSKTMSATRSFMQI